MNDTVMTLRDIITICGGIFVVAAAWFAVKYQGILNAKDIETVGRSNEEQWKKINATNETVMGIKERLITAINMETAEKKFVTQELFDLTMKQFELDLKQTKAIAQNTLDAVNNLTSSLARS